MIARSTPKVVLALVASIALAATSGCGAKPTVDDTAEVTPSKTPAPAPEPAKESPKE